MGLRRTIRAVNRDLDTMVARTPERRDRYVDFLRVLAIGVVVVWHWSLSILYWSGDRWVMPNPIGQVPGGWAATWLLQIMPVFFIVGGYANAAAWWSARRDGRGLVGYYRNRLRRLLLPIGVFAAAWTAFELVAHLVIPDYPGVLRYGWIAFTPLWFVLAYLWVVLLAPLTASAHARAQWLTLGGLAGAVALADLGRFAGGLTTLGLVNSGLVWVLIHQLGYFFRDLTTRSAVQRQTDATNPPNLPDQGPQRRHTAVVSIQAVAMVAAGLAGLAMVTSLEAYPRSMVATGEQDRSNIFPTTVTIPLVAVVQLGVIVLVRAPVARWLRRPGAWKPVVAANAVIMTIFLWHMTALLVVLGALRGLGLRPGTEPTAAWWWQRPLWLVAPAPVLAVLVAIFGRFERLRQRKD